MLKSQVNLKEKYIVMIENRDKIKTTTIIITMIIITTTNKHMRTRILIIE